TNLAQFGPLLVATSYFGGSGDDRPTAVSAAFNPFFVYYIAGETNSLDFPSADGNPLALNGPSDAFLMRITAAANVPLPVDRAVLLGGSGSDRAAAITVTQDGTVVVAGVTDSTDFPLAQPLQPALAGATDVFVSRWDSGLSAMSSSTYLGGSGAEEVNA